MSKQPIFWFGPRRGDLLAIEHEFSGAIVIMGADSVSDEFMCKSYESGLGKRVNHNDNEHYKDINNFFKNAALDLIKEFGSPAFYFYGRMPSNFQNELSGYSIGQNDFLLSELLSDKMRMRILLSRDLPVLPFSSRFSHECSYGELKSLFPSYSTFVLQEAIGSSGGFSTYLLKTEQENELLNQISSKDLMVSPYFENSTPVNQHLVIYKDEIVTFPPSVQLVQEYNSKLIYLGGDYLSFHSIPHEIKSAIESSSKVIGQTLKKLGYRGVVGIDYLIGENGQSYFVEINPRFQASTFVLNKALKNDSLPSMQQLHLEAFSREKCSITDHIELIKYSFINTINTDGQFQNEHDGNFSLVNIEPIKSDLGSKTVQLNYQVVNTPAVASVEITAVLKTTVFEVPVTVKGKGQNFKIHPSILHLSKTGLPSKIGVNSGYGIAALKFDLLTQGIRISESAKEYIYGNQKSAFQYAIGYAVDILIAGNIYINIPVRTHLAVLSLYSLEWFESEGFWICYDGSKFVKTEIAFRHPLTNKKTSNGVGYNLIAQMITDRLRISPFPTCKFNFRNGLACKFCDIGYSEEKLKYRLEDICEVIEDYLSNESSLQHFLIGGGTAGESGWKLIKQITEFIRSKTKKNIYLMVAPPERLEVLKELHAAGITEVGFNLELYNRDLAMKLMPGKAQCSKNRYLETFSYATKLWGKTGNVRSILIVGIEDIQNTLEGVEFLCKAGVMPILSAFRPIPSTEMENFPAPSYEYLLHVWEEAQKICQNYGLILGPKCAACQNNTLAMPPKILSKDSIFDRHVELSF